MTWMPASTSFGTPRTWVVLEADGKTVYNDEMRKGDHAAYEASALRMA